MYVNLWSITDIIKYLQPYIDKDLIEYSVKNFEHSFCFDIESKFEKNECKRLKGILRNNGFKSDGCGTYYKLFNK